MLSESSLRKRGLYHPAFVADLIAADRSGAEDNAFWIWQLLTVELWFRIFFDSSIPEPDVRQIVWNQRSDGIYETASHRRGQNLMK